MNLVTEVRLKNSQLMVQRIALQRQLNLRANNSYFKSCWMSLVLEPFVVGALAQRFLGGSGAAVYQFARLMFPSLRFWSIF